MVSQKVKVCPDRYDRQEGGISINTLLIYLLLKGCSLPKKRAIWLYNLKTAEFIERVVPEKIQETKVQDKEKYDR